LKYVIAFDLDGTLIESKDAIANAVEQTLKVFKLAPIDQTFVKESIGRPIREVFMTVSEDASLLDKLVSNFRAELAQNGHEFTRIMPGVVESLDVLKREGYILSIASNKPSSLSIIILEQLGLLKFFKFIAGPDLAKEKPSSEMLEKIVVQSNCKLVTLVGDTQDDLLCANNYGVDGIFYNFEKKSPPNSFPANLSFIEIDHFDHLPRAIKTLKGEKNG